MKQIKKRPVGRPTRYTSKTIPEVEKYLIDAVPENMAIPTIEGIALRLNVNRDTLYEWASVHKDFSDTLEKMRVLQKEALIRTGIFGGKEINSTIIMLLLKVNHDMVEKTAMDITSGGQPIPILGNSVTDVHKDNSDNKASTTK
jgi:hypothetical protein